MNNNTMKEKITVELENNRSYQIHIGYDNLDDLIKSFESYQESTSQARRRLVTKTRKLLFDFGRDLEPDNSLSKPSISLPKNRSH